MGQSKEVGGKAEKRCWWLHTEQCSLLCVGIFSVYALLWGRVLGYSARRLLCFSYGRTFCCLLIKKSLPERRKEEKGKSSPVQYYFMSGVYFCVLRGHWGTSWSWVLLCFVSTAVGRHGGSLRAPVLETQWCSERAAAYLYHTSFTYELLFFFF